MHLAATCLSIAVLLGPAATAPSSQPAVVTADGNGALKFSILRGAEVEVLGLCDVNDVTKWWAADGTAIKPAIQLAAPNMPLPAGVNVVLRIRGPADLPRVKWKPQGVGFVQSNDRTEIDPADEKVSVTYQRVTIWTDGGKPLAMDAVLDTGEWKTVAEWDTDKDPPAGPVQFGTLTSENGVTQIACEGRWALPARIAVVDHTGEAHVPDDPRTFSDGQTQKITCTFDQPATAVKAVRFELCGRQVIRLRDVATKPGQSKATAAVEAIAPHLDAK